jgi:hypothetical protein
VVALGEPWTEPFSMLPRASHEIARDPHVDHSEWPVRDNVNPTSTHAERYAWRPVNKSPGDVPHEMAGSSPAMTIGAFVAGNAGSRSAPAMSAGGFVAGGREMRPMTSSDRRGPAPDHPGPVSLYHPGPASLYRHGPARPGHPNQLQAATGSHQRGAIS